MKYENGLTIAAGVTLAACHVPVGAPPSAAVAVAVNEAFADQCTAVPGYREFRADLHRIVRARDGDGLRALFHASGAMRVNGIGGRANTSDWGFGRPGAVVVWQELEQILELGCMPQGEELILPAMAGLTGAMEPDQMMALQRVEIRTEPRPDAPVMLSARPGDLFTFSAYDQPPGWTSLLVDGRMGYAPTFALRSPYSYRLELERHEGGWRIDEFGDGV